MSSLPHHTDQDLFALVKSGNAIAFDTLYQRHFEKLYFSAYRRLKDQDACRDIVQDVFIDLWQRAASIDNTNVEGYLHTAVRYQVLKRAAKSRQSHFYSLVEEMGAWVGRSGRKEDVPQELRYRELLHLVDLWIETLPPKRREIFLLHYREQLSAAEIAARLQLTEKTVQNQLGLAFGDLRGKLPDLTVILILSQLPL